MPVLVRSPCLVNPPVRPKRRGYSDQGALEPELQRSPTASGKGVAEEKADQAPPAEELCAAPDTEALPAGKAQRTKKKEGSLTKKRSSLTDKASSMRKSRRGFKKLVQEDEGAEPLAPLEEKGSLPGLDVEAAAGQAPNGAATTAGCGSGCPAWLPDRAQRLWSMGERERRLWLRRLAAFLFFAFIGLAPIWFVVEVKYRERVARMGAKLMSRPKKMRRAITKLCRSGDWAKPTKNYEVVKEMIETSCGFESDPTRSVQRNVAYFRGHKLMSGLLYYMFAGYGMRHRLKFIHGRGGSAPFSSDPMYFDQAACGGFHEKYRGAFNIECRSVSSSWLRTSLPCDRKDGTYIHQVMKAYNFLIESPIVVMEFPDALQNLLSALKLAGATEKETSDATSALAIKRFWNPMAQELGLRNMQDVKKFIGTYIASGKVFPLDMAKLDEALVVMRRVMNIDLIDILYPRAKLVAKASKKIERQALDALRLDRALVSAAWRYYEQLYSLHVEQSWTGAEELLAFKSLSHNVDSGFCSEALRRVRHDASWEKAAVICKVQIMYNSTDEQVQEWTRNSSALFAELYAEAKGETATVAITPDKAH